MSVELRKHPIHLMAVHFPTALLLMDVIFGGVSLYLKNDALAQTAYYCLVAGIISGGLTMLTGMLDYFWYILKPRSEGAKRGLVHGAIQSCVILGFTFVTAYEYHHPVAISNPPVWVWFVKGLLILILLAGNYLGAELLFRYVIKQLQH